MIKNISLHALKKLNPLHRGIVFGLLAAFIFFLLFKGLFAEQEGPFVEALIVIKDLEVGQEINEEWLALKTYPIQYVPKGVVMPNHLSIVTAKKIRVPLEKGSALRWHDLQSNQPEYSVFSSQIPKGYRAIALPFYQGKGISHLLKDGDFIDILGTFVLENGQKEITKTLFQKVRVLKAKPEPILLVTPEQAELLLFAKNQGRLFGSLRNHEDTLKVKSLPQHEFHKFLGLKTRKNRHALSRTRKNGPQIIPLQSTKNGS